MRIFSRKKFVDPSVWYNSTGTWLISAISRKNSHKVIEILCFLSFSGQNTPIYAKKSKCLWGFFRENLRKYTYSSPICCSWCGPPGITLAVYGMYISCLAGTDPKAMQPKLSLTPSTDSHVITSPLQFFGKSSAGSSRSRWTFVDRGDCLCFCLRRSSPWYWRCHPSWDSKAVIIFSKNSHKTQLNFYIFRCISV